MNIPDLINGCFEISAGILLWLNVRKLLKDKQLRGITILPTLVFGLWGFWNLYYYPYLKQMISFVGGISVVAANTTWVILAIYYYRKTPNK